MSWIKHVGEAVGLSSSDLHQLLQKAQTVILGKQNQLQLALCSILAQGHVLLEDVPGVGKTTLVKTLAALLGLKTTRIQFTNDLLPADILGTSVFDSSAKDFIFHPGPIFGQIVIGDELNRATPKTQSALLQAMEERRVTVDGQTHNLPQPFFVVATQNPSYQTGTYPLPESQLDRFMMRIEMGFPDRQAEEELLNGHVNGRGRDLILQQLTSTFSADQLSLWQTQVEKVYVSPTIIHYLQDLLEYTRTHPQDMQGLSPRAAIAWLRAARAWAFLHERTSVLPEDVQAVGVSVMSHRIAPAKGSFGSGERLARQVLQAVSVE